MFYCTPERSNEDIRTLGRSTRDNVAYDENKGVALGGGYGGRFTPIPEQAL